MTTLREKWDLGYERALRITAVGLVLATIRRSTAVRVPRMAGAMTFYLLLSVAPLLVVVVGVAGLIVGPRATDMYEQMLAQLGEQVGARVAETIASMVAAQARRPAEGLATTGIGLLALLGSASRAFNEFQDALNTIWDVEPPGGLGPGVIRTLRQRTLSVVVTVAGGILLTLYVMVRPAVNTFGHNLTPLVPAAVDVMSALNAVLAYILIAVVLACLYRFLPETPIGWGDVWLGSLLVALVLTVGQLAFTVYLDFARQLGFLGAASSPLVVLALAHAAVQTVYLGAAFSRAFADHLGSRAPTGAPDGIVDRDA